MAKKTRTELSTLAINTNLPDNTTELITPTTERAQLTDERESVVNYKDDLGGTGNAGKFLTVAVDGESLTMVDEPSGVPAWVTFVTGLDNIMKLQNGGTTQSPGLVEIEFYDVDGTTQAAYFAWIESTNRFKIAGAKAKTSIELRKENATPNDTAGDIVFLTGENLGSITERLTISSGGNVGIGEDDPTWLLELKKDSSSGAGGTYPAIAVNNPNVDGYSAFYLFNGTQNVGGLEYNNTTNILSLNSLEGNAVSIPNGIAFPNQSAGSGTVSSSTLDAYEEGMFVVTASISGASGAITIDAVDNELSYTRIGERVFISGFVKIATNTANGGRFNLLGFPFTSGSDDGLTILQVQIEGGTGTQTSGFFAVMFASSTTLTVKTYTGVGTSNNSALTLQANTVVAVSGSYKVA